MTTANAVAPANLEEYTDKQLRKKCLYYGLQNIPITDESRQMVIDKLRECVAKQDEKKLALKNRRTLASNQKYNSISRSPNEKPAVEKFNITSKQLSSARIVGASVLQELRKKEKIKLLKDRAAAKELNLLKQKESESSSSTPNLTKSPIPIKVIRKRPSLSGAFGIFKENPALKPKPIDINKPVDKLNLKLDKKVKPADNRNMRNLKLLRPKKSKESIGKLKGLNKSLEIIHIDIDLNENADFKHNNKSFTVLSADSSVKENVEIITEKLKNLDNLNEVVPNKGTTTNFEFNKNQISNFEECPENLEIGLESEGTADTDKKMDFDLATAVLFPETEIHEMEFSCKEDSDLDDDCLDCLSSDDSPATERYYSIRYKSYNNISE